MDLEVTRRLNTHEKSQFDSKIERIKEAHFSHLSMMKSQHKKKEFLRSKAHHVKKEMEDMKRKNTALIKQYEDKVQTAENRLYVELRSQGCVDEDTCLKEKEMHKERLERIESALKEKTAKLIEHLNCEKARKAANKKWSNKCKAR